MTIQGVLLQTLPCVMTGSIVTHYLDDGDTTKPIISIAARNLFCFRKSGGPSSWTS
jgi:hypothetical protein